MERRDERIQPQEILRYSSTNGNRPFDFNLSITYIGLPNNSQFEREGTLPYATDSIHHGDRSIEQGTTTVRPPSYDEITSSYFGQAPAPSLGGSSFTANSLNHAPGLTYGMPGGSGMRDSMLLQPMPLPSNFTGNMSNVTFDQSAAGSSYSQQPPSQRTGYEHPGT